MHGVKVSGAPPPRKVIVQQCIRDKGVLEVLCNYVSIFSSNLLLNHHSVSCHGAIMGDLFATGNSVKEGSAVKARDKFLHSSCHRDFGFCYIC